MPGLGSGLGPWVGDSGCSSAEPCPPPRSSPILAPRCPLRNIVGCETGHCPAVSRLCQLAIPHSEDEGTRGHPHFLGTGEWVAPSNRSGSNTVAHPGCGTMTWDNPLGAMAAWFKSGLQLRVAGSTPAGRGPQIRGLRAGGSLAVASLTPASQPLLVTSGLATGPPVGVGDGLGQFPAA